MSHKVRIHELAKKYEKNSKEIINELSKIGIELQSHLSGIESKDIDKVTTYLDRKFLLNNKEIKEVKNIKETNKKVPNLIGTLRKKTHEVLPKNNLENLNSLEKNLEEKNLDVSSVSNDNIEKNSEFISPKATYSPYSERRNNENYRNNNFQNRDRNFNNNYNRNNNLRDSSRDREENGNYRNNNFQNQNRDRTPNENYREENGNYRNNNFQNQNRDRIPNENYKGRGFNFQNNREGRFEGRSNDKGSKVTYFRNQSNSSFYDRNSTRTNENRSDRPINQFPFKRNSNNEVSRNSSKEYIKPTYNKKPLFPKKDETAVLLDLGKQDRRKNSKKKYTKDYEGNSNLNLNKGISSISGINKKKVLMDDIGSSYPSNRKSYKRKKKEVAQQKEEKAKNLLKEERIITAGEDVTLKLLAEKIGISPTEIVKYLFLKGHSFTVNSLIPFNLVEEIAGQYNTLVAKEEKREKYIQKIDQDDNNLQERAPIITIIGHVDHGKTSLLDSIRKSSVASQEEGGITQRIGAYQIEKDNKKITFIDTPGHEAFSDMRARGTGITDIAVLVVAADDGVMPQTIEAISHAKYSKVPIVVAINKIDKPEANVDRVKQQLTEHELLPREWGGETEVIEISVLKNINLDRLLDTLILMAEILGLKSNPDKLAKAIVLEARLDSKIGAVASVIVKEGTLKKGDVFVLGNAMGKVRAIINENGKKLEYAVPSTPVEIFGLSKVPEAGDILIVAENEKSAKKIITDSEIKDEKSTIYSSIPTIEGENSKDYRVIIKTGSKGSLEVIKNSILKLHSDEVKISLIYSATGSVNESDIKLAQASEAVIITFEVLVAPSARKYAEDKKVDIKSYNIIYKLIEDLQDEIKNFSTPKFKEIYQGRVEVKKVFKISKVGTIAGSIVTDGKINKNSTIKIFRNTKEIFEGKISSLKRFNNDVNIVEVTQECGITLEKYNDIKEGDIFEAYTSEKVQNE